MGNLILIAVGSALVSNVVLSQFLGICSFLGVSKKTETAAGMGGAVIFVITLASLVAGILHQFILKPLGFEYLNTIVFILVIAALVQILEKVCAFIVQCSWSIPSTDHNKLCSAWCSSE